MTPMPNKPIFVTQPYLPPLEEFIPYLAQIWDRKILTNGGPLHQQLETALCEYLGVEHIALFANGTLALVTALQALRITGEVITTPYSFVATAHSLLWNGIKPVFVDIDENGLDAVPQEGMGGGHEGIGGGNHLAGDAQGLQGGDQRQRAIGEQGDMLDPQVFTERGLELLVQGAAVGEDFPIPDLRQIGNEFLQRRKIGLGDEDGFIWHGRHSGLAGV